MIKPLNVSLSLNFPVTAYAKFKYQKMKQSIHLKFTLYLLFL